MCDAHNNEFAEKGWVGLFLVKDDKNESVNQSLNVTSIANNTSYSKNNFSNLTNIVPIGGYN